MAHEIDLMSEADIATTAVNLLSKFVATASSTQSTVIEAKKLELLHKISLDDAIKLVRRFGTTREIHQFAKCQLFRIHCLLL
jgi:hypothetical protein